MEAHPEMKILAILLLCCATSVKLQDDIESSGAGAVTSDLIIPGLFETFASGEGPDITSDAGANVGIIADLDQELNGTYIPLVPNIGGINSVNDTGEVITSDTTTKDADTTVFSHTEEVGTSTTMRETTILTDKTDALVTDTSSTSTASSTESTTTKPPTTTTSQLVTTSRHTTLRTTKRPTPPRTVKPVLTTTSTTDYDPLPCSFNVEDLQCSEELVCFGEGEVDCTEPDVSEMLAKASAVLHSTGAEYEDEYEDSAMFSTEPSDLTIRLPAWKKLLGMKRHQFSSTTTTTDVNHDEETTPKAAVANEMSAAQTTTQSEFITDAILRVSDTSAFNVNIPTSSKGNPEVETTSKFHTELPTTHSDVSVENESLEMHPPNSEINISNDNPNSEISSDSPINQSSDITTQKISISTLPDNSESTEMIESKSRRRRSKRQNKQPVPESSILSSEQLKLSSFSVTKDQKDQKLCRIKGNLLCTPTPALGLCKGSGRCHAVVETKEKSTGEKGVENWAIAVIAICATAAAVTISLLIYLVVTSWKKLKVQPQNGVTTLTYVNNSTP